MFPCKFQCYETHTSLDLPSLNMFYIPVQPKVVRYYWEFSLNISMNCFHLTIELRMNDQPNEVEYIFLTNILFCLPCHLTA